MYLFFDVETKGLYGEAFAVGFVVTNDCGDILTEKMFVSKYQHAQYAENDINPIDTDSWMAANVLPVLPAPDLNYPCGMRDMFYEFWWGLDVQERLSGNRLLLAADICYPCESEFLRQVHREHADFTVYPLIDISSVLLAKGYDPIGVYDRLPSELPTHNPLNDARQSARIFFTVMRGEKL